MDAIRLHIAQTLDRYFRDQAADACTAKATRALLYEVSATPKPGLVDRANSGSHRDMDFFTFLDSSSVLSPWFREMFCIGWDNCGAPSYKLFQRLRFTGQQAEAAMLAATNGVNTHKGLIFSLGLLCGALGALQSQEPEPLPMERVLALCGELGTFALEDFKEATATNGTHCYLAHNVSGVRGEAARGFPTAAYVGLPALKKWTAAGLSLNDAAAVTLLTLIAHTEDTNMIHRGGLELARQRQKQAADLLDRLSLDNYSSVLNSLDQQYMKENLSPGGCADLLAISLMLLFTLM